MAEIKIDDVFAVGEGLAAGVIRQTAVPNIRGQDRLHVGADAVHADKVHAPDHLNIRVKIPDLQDALLRKAAVIEIEIAGGGKRGKSGEQSLPVVFNVPSAEIDILRGLVHGHTIEVDRLSQGGLREAPAGEEREQQHRKRQQFKRSDFHSDDLHRTSQPFRW